MARRASADELVLLTEDAIDFCSLETTTLEALALQQREPFIATSALGMASVVVYAPERFRSARSRWPGGCRRWRGRTSRR